MRMIVVEFEDSVVTESIPEGTTGITVSNGTTTLLGGLMRVTGARVYVSPSMADHVHPIAGTISGGPVPPDGG